MLRKVLRRSAAARLAQPAPGNSKRLPRRFLIHTNACKREDVDEDRGDASPATAKQSVRPVTLTTDHRSLFSSSTPQAPQQQSAPVHHSDSKHTASRESRAAEFPSLELKPLNGTTHGITAKDIEAYVVCYLCCMNESIWRCV